MSSTHFTSPRKVKIINTHLYLLVEQQANLTLCGGFVEELHAPKLVSHFVFYFLSPLNYLSSHFCSCLLFPSHLCCLSFPFIPFLLFLPLSPQSPSLLLSALCHVVVGIMCSGCQLCQACSRSAPWPVVYLHEELNKLEEGLKLFLITIRFREGNEYGDLVVKQVLAGSVLIHDVQTELKGNTFSYKSHM